MRRIYDSEALDRDDDEPFQPNERRRRAKPRASRTLPAKYLSDLLVPQRVRHRAISVDISTPRSTYESGTPIPFEVSMRNEFPFPVTLSARSPLLWYWHVDGHREASHVPEEPSGESTPFEFDRGETKRFRRTWSGSFQRTRSEWEKAGRGEYTVGVEINVDDAEGKGLADRTTVRIE